MMIPLEMRMKGLHYNFQGMSWEVLHGKLQQEEWEVKPLCSIHQVSTGFV